MDSPVRIQENINGSLQDLVTVSDIIDFGSNSNGFYVRFSWGLQVCWNCRMRSGEPTGSTMEIRWIYPSQFVDSRVACLGITNTAVDGIALFAHDATGSDQAVDISFSSNTGAMIPGSFTISCIAISRS